MGAHETLLRRTLRKKTVIPFSGRYRVTSPYGWRVLNGANDFHNGVDLVGVDDITVICPADGECIMSGYGTECGNQMQIYTTSGVTLFLCHLKTRYVNVGDKIKQGQPVGVMGATGTKCFGAHLHFGVYRGKGRNGELINAQEYLGI